MLFTAFLCESSQQLGESVLLLPILYQCHREAESLTLQEVHTANSAELGVGPGSQAPSNHWAIRNHSSEAGHLPGEIPGTSWASRVQSSGAKFPLGPTLTMPSLRRGTAAPWSGSFVLALRAVSVCTNLYLKQEEKLLFLSPPRGFSFSSKSYLEIFNSYSCLFL